MCLILWLILWPIDVDLTLNRALSFMNFSYNIQSLSYLLTLWQALIVYTAMCKKIVLL